jgi:hypothetical protein
MVSRKSLAESIEFSTELPSGNEERFSGHGVMWLAFVSGRILSLRRFPAFSLGQGYTSVWYRNPEEDRTFIQDVQPHYACLRYFGNAVSNTLITNIEIIWSGEQAFSVAITGDYNLEWHVTLAGTLATGKKWG